ncbi:hypothetical protein H3H54_13685 [Brachybacterium sp. Z12]|uniref:hypothetical protein n=1 Tax=Brachybacterium sp. Z12 TaxID=2759167 RepID=UPI001860A15A|nr:hypothetical protein [Brachybacterium sp. Z12]QNN82172.1 hypothetical protein H3H54_13685 [Brachybacterium sp. Z12]
MLTTLSTGTGHRVVLLAADSTHSLRASVHADEAAGGDGEPVPLIPAGEGLFALSLQDGSGRETRWLKVEDDIGHVVLTIPEAVSIPRTQVGGSVLSAAADGGKRTVRAIARRLGVRRPRR